jgi:hypothetical protein
MLNAYSVPFVDIDARHELTGILSISDRPLIDESDDQNAELPGTKLRQFLEKNSDWGFRVYQTFAGYRYLCITHELAPQADDTAEMLTQLGTDKLYAELCRERNTFRARLTAKPWRMLGRSFLPWNYRYWSRERFALAHIRDYLKVASHFAACRYIRNVGYKPRRLAKAIRRVIEIHDELSGALAFKPLA